MNQMDSVINSFNPLKFKIFQKIKDKEILRNRVSKAVTLS